MQLYLNRSFLYLRQSLNLVIDYAATEREVKMKYTLDTQIKFGVALGRSAEEQIETMEELGFTQEELDTKSNKEIEKELQQLYDDWEANYLDAGWAVVEN